MKPGGRDLVQALTSTPSATGTFKLIPRTLALIAVHRHKATSKSANPESKAQHLLPEGGSPTTTLTSPRRSTQTPSFNASIGQVSFAGGGGEGFGFGLQEPQASEKVEKIRIERTKMQAERFLEAIASCEKKKLRS